MFRTPLMAVVVASVLLLTGWASAQTAPPAESSPPPPAAEPASPSYGLLDFDAPYATGDWGGLRTDLQDHGVKITSFLTNYYMGVLEGGFDTDSAGRNYTSMDVLVSFDLEKLGVIDNAEALMHFQGYWGAGVNNLTGAFRQVSDDGDDTGEIVAQVWYRHYFLERQVSLQLGYLDFQTMIDRNAYANSEDRQFQNQALDNNSLLPMGPGLGAALTYKPCDWYTFVLGALDAGTYPVLYAPGFDTTFQGPATFLGYMQHAFHVNMPSAKGDLPGNYRVGLVYDPRVKAEFEHPELSEGTDWVVFSSCDQMLFREVADSDQGLGVFARLGWNHPERNRFEQFYSGGAQYQGLIPGRDQDVLGLGFTYHRTSGSYREYVSDAINIETVWEAYYAFHVTKWLVVSPDFQYIDNPARRGDVGHTLVGGLRVRINF